VLDGQERESVTALQVLCTGSSSHVVDLVVDDEPDSGVGVGVLRDLLEGVDLRGAYSM
jgi:hypothetical protein